MMEAMDTILPISDPRLRLVSQPVVVVDDAVRTLVQRLFAILDRTGESAIAAIQIGVALQVVALDMEDGGGQRHRLGLINPRLLACSSQTSTHLELCSSIPGQPLIATRSRQVTVGYLDLEGVPCELQVEGALAVCIQHEMEHLAGHSLLDGLSPFKRARVLAQLAKLRRNAGRSQV